MPSADLPAAPATAADVNTATTSSESQAAPAKIDTPAAKPDVTADVTRMLMDGKIDGVDPTKAAEPTKVADQTADAPDTPEQPATTAEHSEAPVELDLPKVRHPFDDAEDPTLDDIDGRAAEKTRAGFQRLQGRLRQAREEGQFGSMIIDVARSHDLDPDTVATVIALTAKARKGDAKALADLQGVMTKIGIALPNAAIPAADKEALLDVESSKVYKELFAADVESAEISEGKAREKAKAIAEDRLKLRALSQPNIQSTAPQTTQPTGGSRLSPMQLAASNAVEVLAAKYADAYKKSGADFAPVQKAAQALIAEKVKKDGPINPMYWEYEFSQAVAAVQRKRQGVQQKPAPTTGTAPLRPSAGGGANGGKSGDDFRKQIVGKMVSGQLDKI